PICLKGFIVLILHEVRIREEPDWVLLFQKKLLNIMAVRLVCFPQNNYIRSGLPCLRINKGGDMMERKNCIKLFYHKHGKVVCIYDTSSCFFNSFIHILIFYLVTFK